jgi:cold shock CspA family protein
MSDKKDKLEHARAQVKFFSSDRGYGFLKRPNKQDVFFTRTALTRAGIDSVKENDTLEFDIVPVPGKGGKAINLKKV